MITTTLDATMPNHCDSGACLYVIQDGETVFYVGMTEGESRSAWQRIAARAHFTA